MVQGATFLIAICGHSTLGGVGFCYETLHRNAFHHGRVVGISHHGVLGRQLVGVADHPEQALFLRHAIDGELGVEDLVSTMFAVGLSEHHQFHIGGVAAQRGEGVHQIVDLVAGQRQAEAGVGSFQLGPSAPQNIHMLHGRRAQLGEKAERHRALEHHAFGHAVVQERRHGLQLVVRQAGVAQQAGLQRDAVFGHALHTLDGQAAVVRNVGRLGGPGRDGAKTWRNNDQAPATRSGVGVAVGQQGRQGLAIRVRRRSLRGHQMHKSRGNALNPVMNGRQARKELLDAKSAEGVAAIKLGDVQGHGGGLEWVGRWQETRKTAADWGHSRKP